MDLPSPRFGAVKIGEKMHPLISYPVLNGPRPYLGQDTFQGRVEVSDSETGAFIEGATVSVAWPNDPPTQAPASIDKVTDQGGNAAFSSDEFVEAGMPESTDKADVFYHVSAEGYEPQEKLFVGGEITNFDMVPVVEVAENGGGDGGNGESNGGAKEEFPWLLAAGGVGVTALIVAIVVS